jgi:hypothetical protein
MVPCVGHAGAAFNAAVSTPAEREVIRAYAETSEADGWRSGEWARCRLR